MAEHTQPQVILAVDTATEFCSVALWAQGKLYKREELAPQKRAAHVLALIDEVLQEAEVARSKVELIGFAQGPGSFTGVRITIAVAQAFAFSLDRLLFGVDNLKLLAHGALVRTLMEQENTIARFTLAAIDARMSEVYFALYENEQQKSDGQELKLNYKLLPIIEPKVLNPQQALSEIKEILLQKGASFNDICFAGTGIALMANISDFNVFKLMQAHLSVEDQAKVATKVDFDVSDLSKVVAEVNELNQNEEFFNLYPRASSIIDLFLDNPEDYKCLDPALAEPVYCRNEVTWKKISEQ